MTPKKLKSFRYRLVRLLNDIMPGRDAVEIGMIANHLERFMMHEAFKLTEIEHAQDCGCWDCIGSVLQDVMRHQSEMAVARQMAEQYD